jgi:hypothetical protein
MALALLIILILGFFNSTFSPLGLSFLILRALRWAINTPLLYIIAANLVFDEKRVKLLLLTLVAATFCAEAQHFTLAASLNVNNLAAEDPELFRSSAFAFGVPELWLLAGPFLLAGRLPRPWLQLGMGSVLLAGIFITQSRGETAAFLLTIVAYQIWFLQGPNGLRWKRLAPLLKIAFLSGFLLIIFHFTSMPLNIWTKVDRTISTYDTEKYQDPRYNDAIVEGTDFIQGNIYTMLFGRGLCYFEVYRIKPALRKLPKKIGFGHVGYITYLSQLGLVGFFFYALFFPASVFLNARRVFQDPDGPPVIIHLAALAGACFLYYPILFIFSSSFLITHIYPGILAGAIWRISLPESVVASAVTQPLQEGAGPSAFQGARTI